MDFNSPHPNEVLWWIATRREQMNIQRLRSIFVLSILLAANVRAETSTNNPLLTIDRIFEAGEFDGDGFGRVSWSKLSSHYHKMEKPEAGGSGMDLVRYDPADGRKEVLVPAHVFTPPGQSGGLSVERFKFSEDESKVLIFTNSKRVWRQNTRGDYWVLDITSRELRKLGGDAPASTLMFAKFSPDGLNVAYVRGNNLFVQRLRDLEIRQLTSDGSPQIINGTFDWVYEEELFLRDGCVWSPDSQSIAYWQLDSSGVREFHLINNTDGFYSKPVPIPYPKTGEQNSSARIGVIPAVGGETRWLPIPGDPRNHYLARLAWMSNSTEVAVQQFNRLQNTNRVFLATAEGKVKHVFTDTDRAWLDNENPFRLVNEGREFIWLSERDGWRHAYSVETSGKDVSKITRGEFDVMAIDVIDEKGGWLYFSASPTNATQRYLYRTRLKGGPSERITPSDQPGTHHYDISPDARWAIHTFSTFNSPPVTDLVQLPEHKRIRVLEQNQKLVEKLNLLKKPAHQFFQIDIGEKVLLDGWCIKPPDFDPSRKYPVLFHVYGEPAGQTVLDEWPGRTGLWHWMLAQQGYVIMSVDNRGTPAPRGRDWRKIVHRQVGILSSADQAGAVRAILKERSWVDEARVGVWGWSGGGSMTLNAIFRYPDLYHAGISVAPVPNQRYYDTIYQERYMGLPEDNAEGYRKGSPLTYAHQLKGKLLLVHGTGDDNVHYQGTEALINELIAWNKPFSMMAYPNRSHGISEGRNTRRHLFELMASFLKANLPAQTPAAGSVHSSP